MWVREKINLDRFLMFLNLIHVTSFRRTSYGASDGPYHGSIQFYIGITIANIYGIRDGLSVLLTFQTEFQYGNFQEIDMHKVVSHCCIFTNIIIIIIIITIINYYVSAKAIRSLILIFYMVHIHICQVTYL